VCVFSVTLFAHFVQGGKNLVQSGASCDSFGRRVLTKNLKKIAGSPFAPVNYHDLAHFWQKAHNSPTQHIEIFLCSVWFNI